MDLIERLNWRYATKKFDNSRKLSKEKLETLIQTFNLTPTSYGVQTMKMIVISDDSIKSKMVDLCYGQEQVKGASHVLAICIQDHVNESDVDAYFDNVVRIRKTPEVILSKYRKELKEFIKFKNQERIRNLVCQSGLYCLREFDDGLCSRRNRLLPYGRVYS